MPEFLPEFIQELTNKSARILKDFENTESKDLYKDIFYDYWKDFEFKGSEPTQKVVAIDSSIGDAPLFNGGSFYVARALGLSKEKKYRRIESDFDFLRTTTSTNFLGRLMEWTEHLVAIDVIKDGFDGTILIDGSIYGRLVHLPIELNLLNSKGFMIDYFETIIELLKFAKEKNILLIGISKESRTSFFREFLIKELLKSIIPDSKMRKILVSTALDDKKKGRMNAENTGDLRIIMLINDLINRKPDNLLILNNKKGSGYTHPLLLGASQRWRRRAQEISTDANRYIESQFPSLYTDPVFVEKARIVVNQLLDVPGIVSFHALPSSIDTPMRVDIPSFAFGVESKLLEVGWPKVMNVDLSNVLEIISAGYCGLENYNIWLKAVDDEVKLKRKNFERLYLNKFEEIIGKYTTPRGYRRVRYP